MVTNNHCSVPLSTDRVYSTPDACRLAQTTREAVRHLQRTEPWFAKMGRCHARWSQADVATLAILSHLVQDLGLRANAVSGFAELIWHLCVEHDCAELISKRLFISMIEFEVALVTRGEDSTMRGDGLVIPSLL